MSSPSCSCHHNHCSVMGPINLWQLFLIYSAPAIRTFMQLEESLYNWWATGENKHEPSEVHSSAFNPCWANRACNSAIEGFLSPCLVCVLVPWARGPGFNSCLLISIAFLLIHNNSHLLFQLCWTLLATDWSWIHNSTDTSFECLTVVRVRRQTRPLESPTLKNLLRLSWGQGLVILTAIYFRKARDKHLPNSDQLGTFFF